MLKIACYKESDESISEFKKEMSKFDLFSFEEKDIDEEITWQEESNAMIFSDDYCNYLAKKSEADFVMVFLSSKNWKQGKVGLKGFHVGGSFDGKYVMGVRMRSGYEDTAEHELLHAIDDYIQKYAGIKIEQFLGVKDFDNDIVHNYTYWKRGYVYDSVWEKIAPFLRLAKLKRPTLEAQPTKTITITGTASPVPDKFATVIMPHIFKWEGGYVDDPKDPGGETKYGISKRAHPNVDIKNLTKEHAQRIYFDQYWEAMACDKYQDAIAMMIMDTGVNMGVKRAKMLMQEVLGVAIDGIVGNQTMGAIAKTDPKTFLAKYTKLRIETYLTFNAFKYYGKGWLRRTLDTYIYSLTLL